MVQGPEYAMHQALRQDYLSNSPLKPMQDCRVFVGGLSYDTTDNDLRCYFDRFGRVLEAYVQYDRDTIRHRGFGFVTFSSRASADAVVSRKHPIGGRDVEVKYAFPKDPNGRRPSALVEDKKIFVGGLAPSTKAEHLHQHFEQYGEVVDAVVMTDPITHRPRGFGFVTFHDSEGARQALAVNVHTIHGRNPEVKVAVPRDEMARAPLQPPLFHHQLGNPADMVPRYPRNALGDGFMFPAAQMQFAPFQGDPVDARFDPSIGLGGLSFDFLGHTGGHRSSAGPAGGLGTLHTGINFNALASFNLQDPQFLASLTGSNGL